MATGRTREIGPDEIHAYRTDGVVCLRGLFDYDWVTSVRDAAAQDLATPSKMGHDVTRGGTGQFFADTFVWQHIESLRKFVFESPAADAAAILMGSRRINLLFDQFLIKAPETSTRTPWHHDLPYWPVNGSQVATLWLALDSVTKESGAVEYVRGSHLWGKRFKAQSFRDPNLYKEDLPAVPDIDAMRDELEFVQFELEPGDCTIHHGLTLHGAPGNAMSDRQRRAYITRWTGDDAVYYPRPNIQPMLYDPDIAPGGPLDCALFPLVRGAVVQ